MTTPLCREDSGNQGTFVSLPNSAGEGQGAGCVESPQSASQVQMNWWYLDPLGGLSSYLYVAFAVHRVCRSGEWFLHIQF